MLDFVVEQLSSRIDKVKEMAVATRAAPGPEAIHQRRVSIRRLTEAVRALEDWVDARKAAKLRQRLRPVMKAAGETRNLDIARDLCVEAGADPVAATLAAMRIEAAHRLIEELLVLDLAKLRVPCQPNAAVPAPRALAAAIAAKLIRKYWEAGNQAAQSERDWARLHGFRLATKHLRYTLELFAPAFGPGAQTKLGTLRAVQTHLGGVNDCEIARGLEPVAGDAALDEWLTERQRTEHHKFLAAWNRESPKRGVWLRYFCGSPAGSLK